MSINRLQHKAGNAIRPPKPFYATLINGMALTECGDVSASQGERAGRAKSPAGA